MKEKIEKTLKKALHKVTIGGEDFDCINVNKVVKELSTLIKEAHNKGYLLGLKEGVETSKREVAEEIVDILNDIISEIEEEYLSHQDGGREVCKNE